MFAHLRSKDAVLAKYKFLAEFISKKMRDNMRANVSPLAGLDASNHDVSRILGEIYIREFACAMQTLAQVHGIVGRYHEHAFDNLDAYIGLQPVQLAPHEMTGEQRHASQVLLGVGQSHSEVNAALNSIGLSRKDVMYMTVPATVSGISLCMQDCEVGKMKFMACLFEDNPSVAEDAFDRLNHVSKKVWSLVNMLAFSNLFRFADPKQPICIPNQDDAIFIPHIPTKIQPQPEPQPAQQQSEQQQSEQQQSEPQQPEQQQSEPEQQPQQPQPHQPGIKLTKEERLKKSHEHKFGLCEYCDAGLDAPTDFICHTPTNVGFKLMCNACHEYHNPGRAPDTNFEF